MLSEVQTLPVGSYEKMMTGRLFSRVKLPFRVGVEKPASRRAVI